MIAKTDTQHYSDIADAVRYSLDGTQYEGSLAQARAQFAQLVQRTITTVSDSNITSIGDSAFRHCSNLTSVNFPNVTSIGESAFQGCAAFTSGNFPNATSIGDHAFQSCIALTSAEFPSVTSIGGHAFYGCVLFTRLILHKRAALGNVFAIPNQAIVYVENTDLEWYSTATNWTTIYADGRIKSIDELPSTGSLT